ncbi:MAG TPA: LysM peptidoglycan-binding domain-containing M23 family metallopeptidase [Chloroflexota bacterium]|nr:LysM peptidoglycan-binding domain-containing M23 family metallopeptidase [Chloroflexota bacterium]
MQLQLHSGAMAALLGHLRPALSAARSPSLRLPRVLPRCRQLLDSTRIRLLLDASAARLNPLVATARVHVGARCLYHLAVLAMVVGAVTAAVTIPSPFTATGLPPAVPPLQEEIEVLEVPPAPLLPADASAKGMSIASMEALVAALQGPDGKIIHDKPADGRATNEEASLPKPKTPTKYTVEDGDTVGGIAEQFGISGNTVLWANNLSNPDSLQIGEELLILPVSGVLHTVAGGDNLNDLALTYSVTPESIAEFNALSNPDMLQLGDKLIVPGGKMGVSRVASRSPQPAPAATGSFRWPAGGSITQYFGEGGHSGLDLASATGSPVYAAESGIVVTALKLGYGYGWHLVIDHGNGYRTLYGHLSAFNVDYGERVAKGDRIGSVGNTGLSTGPHLHFELIQNGGRVNPLKYLP